MKKIGYMPKEPVTKEQFLDKKQRAKWKKEKGMLVFSFVNKKPPFDLVDMFIDEPWPFDKVYDTRVKVRIDNMTIPVISLDYLKKLKLKAKRPQDLLDVAQLDEIKKRKKK